jgi:acetoin utilization deacetylase AcuC-like enzyme
MKNQPHGFSFFNNVAIAANYFVEKTKKKAVIIDWDIHHG